jgi:AcrR family transcriptional regulator
MRTSEVRREREMRRREGYREIVLRAAERVILRKGYSALTMDDVAREAQLSKATIYKYVPGKGALLFEIMGQYFDDLKEKMAAIASGPGTASERLAAAVRLALHESESKQSLTRVLWMDKSMMRLMRIFVTTAGKPGQAPAADRKMIGLLREKRQALNTTAVRIFEDGLASGEFRPLNTVRTVEFIEAAIEGYSHIRFWKGYTPASPNAADELTRFIIEGIRNPEQPGKEN